MAVSNKLGLSIIVSLAIMKFGIVPWLDWVSAESELVAQKSNTLVKLQQLDSRRDATEKELIEMTTFLDAYNNKLLDDDDAKVTSTVFDYLKSESSRLELSLTGLRMGDKQDIDVTYYPVRLTVKSGVVNVAKFINALESAPFKIVTAQVRFNSTRRVKDQTIQMSMTLYIPVRERKKVNDN